MQLLTLVLFRLFKTGIDFQKYLKLKVCLRNFDEALINALAHRYVEMLLNNNSLLNKQVLRLLAQARKNHCLTVLLTASISPIANRFYELGFWKVYSSEIVYRDGRFHRLRDLHGRKYTIVKAFLKLREIGKVVVIDDSPEREVIEIAKRDRRLKIIQPACVKNDCEAETT